MVNLRYQDYLSWYETAEKGFLKPALDTALRLLEELLDTRVDPVDRGRFRITASRVKTPQRSFAKLNRDKYSVQFTALDDVPALIDDLVGIRLVCNNLSDINTFQEIIGEIPIDESQASLPLAVQKNSHRDYFATPKPSGYRAFHVNLVVPVPQMKESRRVLVEIQARTLLQDGWGELTHEDSYKPGSTVPAWIVGMSLRMAELLAAVDNIAQDLRTGLDVETQLSVRGSGPESSGAVVAFVASGADAVAITATDPNASASHPIDDEPVASARQRTEVEEALIRETLAEVKRLDKPMALAALSTKLTLIFGTEITSEWAKYGGFKRFLETITPNAILSGPTPGYVHPPGVSIPDGWTTEDTGKGVIPEIIRELRTYDKAIPLIGPERIGQVMEAVANVLRSLEASEVPASNLSASEIDTLARRARADAERRSQLVVRPHATYVLQAVNLAGRMSSKVDVDELREILFARILFMAEKNKIMTRSFGAVEEIRDWLGLNK